jgi:hypothetical protein
MGYNEFRGSTVVLCVNRLPGITVTRVDEVTVDPAGHTICLFASSLFCRSLLSRSSLSRTSFSLCSSSSSLVMICCLQKKVVKVVVVGGPVLKLVLVRVTDSSDVSVVVVKTVRVGIFTQSDILLRRPRAIRDKGDDFSRSAGWPVYILDSCAKTTLYLNIAQFVHEKPVVNRNLCRTHGWRKLSSSHYSTVLSSLSDVSRA